MTDKLRLDIVTPHGLTFSGEVEEITATGTEGEFNVFPGHAPFITLLRTGMLSYRNGNEMGYVFVSSGYADIGPEKVTILADSAERAEDIDLERAKAAMQRAEERLKQAEKTDFARTQSALERATIRVQVAEKKTAR